MTLHPWAVSVAVMDASGAAFLAWAAVSAVRVQASWSPGSATPTQIRMEVLAEGLGMQVRFAAGCFFSAAVLATLAVAWFLPEIVPGAMCGMGVFQAVGPEAGRALSFRLLALAGLWAWISVDGLNRTEPEAPVTPLSARLLLAVAPLAALCVFSTARAAFALDVREPVDCCAAVYRTASLTPLAGWWIRMPAGLPVAAFLGASVPLAVLSLIVRFGRASAGGRMARPLSLLGLVWAAFAAAALVKAFAAYHYGVLHHDCPWCLLLPEHRAVGVALYPALAVVGVESACLPLFAAIRRREKTLRNAALARIRKAAGRILAASLVFHALALAPAVLWRLRFGVWIGG